MTSVGEFWALRVASGEGKGNLVGAMDCAGEPFLAFYSEEDAKKSAAYHKRNYGIDCKPVRFVAAKGASDGSS